MSSKKKSTLSQVTSAARELATNTLDATARCSRVVVKGMLLTVGALLTLQLMQVLAQRLGR